LSEGVAPEKHENNCVPESPSSENQIVENRDLRLLLELVEHGPTRIEELLAAKHEFGRVAVHEPRNPNHKPDNEGKHQNHENRGKSGPPRTEPNCFQSNQNCHCKLQISFQEKSEIEIPFELFYVRPDAV